MHDGDLLKQYLTERSQAAISRLVDRYKDTVVSIAWRQLGDPVAAEDISQEVFLTLIRKAHWLVARPSIAGWLHRATFNYCARFRLRGFRRRRREKEFNEAEIINRLPMKDSREVVRHLDAALDSLPSKEREALILRYYLNQSLKEVGESLGTTEEAARKRVSRGMDRLSQRLQKQGVVVGATAICASLLTDNSYAAPAGFAVKTMSAASAAGLFTKASVTGAVVAQLSLLSKTQVAVLVLAGVSIPAGLLWQRNQRLSGEIQKLREESSPLSLHLAGRSEGPPTGNPRATELSASASAGFQSMKLDVRSAPEGPPVPSARSGVEESRQGLERRQRVEIRVEAIASSLLLTDDQAQQVREILLETAPGKDALSSSFGPSGSGKETSALLKSETERINTLLRPEQQILWTAFLSTERKNRIERRATQDLLFLLGDWQLNDAQKDAAWNIVSNYALKEDDQYYGGLAPAGDLRRQREAEFIQILTPHQRELFLKHQEEQRAIRDHQRGQQSPPSF